ncbi:MAG TPA: TonB-dependent receptor, partial [Rhodothermales bacterium]
TGWRSAFGVRGVMLVVDGVPLTMPDGQAFADVIDPSLVRSAEVIRGPASVFWGNASGGVIYLKTRPESTPFVRLRGMTGSYGERHVVGEALIRTSDSGRLSLFGSHTGRDGYRDHSGGRFERGGLHFRHRLGDRTFLSATAAGALQDAENPGGLTAAQVESNRRQVDPVYVRSGAGKESLQLQAVVAIEHALPLGTLSASAFGVRRDLDNPLTFAFVEVDRLAGGGRVSFASDRSKRLRWALGADIGRQVDDRRNFENDAGVPGPTPTLDQLELVTNAAAFGYLTAEVIRHLDVSAGLRLDATRFEMEDRLVENGDESGDRSFTAWSPSIGVSYQVAPSVVIFANYATSFETPTTTELVNRPDATGGFNPFLDPERSRGFEAGVRGRAGGVRFDFAAYRTIVHDLLLQSQTDEGREYYRNAGSNRQAGLEASVEASPLTDVVVLLAYALNDLRFRSGDLEGNQLPGVPQHRLFARARWTPGAFRFSPSLEWLSQYFVDDANAASTPGYALLTVHTAYDATLTGALRLQPFLEVENALDARYNASVVVNAAAGRFFEPAAGRVVRVGINLEF